MDKGEKPEPALSQARAIMTCPRLATPYPLIRPDMKITINEQIILMALARFKFLTSAQLKHILGCKSLSTVNSAVRSLRTHRYPLIKSIDLGVAPGKGRMAPIHHLTKAGRKCLINWTALKSEDIQLPSNSSVHFQHDYFHRVSTIRFAILFQQWLAANNYGLLEMDVYFNRKRIDEQFRSATRMGVQGRYIEPDIHAVYRANRKHHTICFEQHNGKDAKRALRQIRLH